MRRLGILACALALGLVPPLGALPAGAAPVLPAGFTLVDYPTGQAEYQLTNFAWVGDGDLLTTGKDGTITYVPSGGRPRTLATVPQVRAVGDHGLVGLAPARDYPTSGRVFLGYDKGDPEGTGFGMLEEWRAVPAGAPTAFTKVRTVVDGSLTSPKLVQSAHTHGPDTVVVAPDDTLFWSLGDDAGNDGDPKALRAQDLDQPYGKVLHLTAAGDAVATNPFYSASAPRSWRSMVYASGLRNPFRFTLDPRSGLLHLGDVGWRTTEELDTFLPGANGGWPCYEGAQKTSFSTYAQCQALYAAGVAVPPVWTYPHAGAGASVVGGEFYTGTSYPLQYRGSLFLGDYTRGELWTSATSTTGALTRAPEPDGFARDIGGPVAFHPGPNGDITYADILSGRVRRLVHSAGNRSPLAVLTSRNDPATRTVTYSATRSYDLDGDQLTYTWDLGDGSTATGESVTHSYATAYPATVTLTVRDQLGATGTATATVHPANHSPVVSLHAPPTTTTYAVGDPVDLAATATDVEDGALEVTWQTVLRHCPYAGSCHLHPDGAVTGPTYGEAFTDHGSDTTMVVTVSATDSEGASTSAVYEARPRLHTVSVHSPVPVDVNGDPVASALVVTGAPVQVGAPATSSYWRFTGWSDGGAQTHGFVMPDHDVTLTAAYTTAIDSKYAELGGAASVLGHSTGPEYALPGGRGRSYAGGRILWSPATGAHEVHGPILAKFVSAGGLEASGFPTTDEIGVRGGRASYFTKARIYTSAASGTHVSRGRLLAKYLEAGGPDRYGLPLTDDTQVEGGYYADFTGGRSIYYSRSAGTHLVQGAIRTKYRSMGSERSCLGFPTSDEYTVTSGLRDPFRGRRNTFEDGRITWNAVTHQTRATC